MRYVISILLFVFCTAASARVVVFWQNGFPTVSSHPVSRQSLEKAFAGEDPGFIDVQGLKEASALTEADLLVMPYGSAFPAEAWSSIQGYLKRGGNLLVLGGQPFRVPVSGTQGAYSRGQPQDAYLRELGILHTYEVPQKNGKAFTWKMGYDFLPTLKLDGRKFFVLEGRGLDGLGYMQNPDGEKVAAPVVVVNHMGPMAGEMAPDGFTSILNPHQDIGIQVMEPRSFGPARSMLAKARHPSGLRCSIRPSKKARFPRPSFTCVTPAGNSSASRKPDR
jgi:hypothetical protein